jgi:polysaccharide biosynthesis/export protein
MEGRQKIMRSLAICFLALTCCTQQQVLVVAVAQDQRPRVATNQVGQTETTKPGLADGVWSPALTGERRPLYRLHISDVLQLSFPFSPEFDQTITIQPDGYVALKGAGTLYAESQTLPEFQAATLLAYADTLNDPHVTIVLKEFDKPSFIVSGQVARPGKFELRSDTTVTQALAIAGGLNEEAKHSQVVLFRPASQQQVEAHLLNVKRMLNSRNLDEDVHLKPGDMLFVPQNSISKIRRYLPISSLGMYLNHSTTSQ